MEEKMNKEEVKDIIKKEAGFRQFQINKMPSKSLYISFFPSNFFKKFVVYVVY